MSFLSLRVSLDERALKPGDRNPAKIDEVRHFLPLRLEESWP